MINFLKEEILLRAIYKEYHKWEGLEQIFGVIETILTITQFYLSHGKLPIPFCERLKSLKKEIGGTMGRDLGPSVEKLFRARGTPLLPFIFDKDYLKQKLANYLGRFTDAKARLYDDTTSIHSNFGKLIGQVALLMQANKISYDTVLEVSYLYDFYDALVILEPQYACLKLNVSLYKIDRQAAR
jgi:hypothetical protein